MYSYKSEPEGDFIQRGKGDMKGEHRDLKMLAFKIGMMQPYPRNINSRQQLEEAKDLFDPAASRGRKARLAF